MIDEMLLLEVIERLDDLNIAAGIVCFILAYIAALLTFGRRDK